MGKGKYRKIGLNEGQGFLMYKMTTVARSVVPGVRKCLGLRLQIRRANKRSGKDKSNIEFIPNAQVLQATSVQIAGFLTVIEQ